MVTSLMTATSGQAKGLQNVWATLTPNSFPYDYNFHLHTICSDGKLTPEALMTEALHIGLKGLAITDHHSLQGYERASQWLENRHTEANNALCPTLWTGIEITATLDETQVHLLGYGFDPFHPALIPYTQGVRPQNGLERGKLVIEALHQAGGLVVLAHPARYRQPANRLIPIAAQLGIDGLEAYYAYGNPKPWQSSPPQTEEISYFSDLYGLWKTGGTDSHGHSIVLSQ